VNFTHIVNWIQIIEFLSVFVFVFESAIKYYYNKIYCITQNCNVLKLTT